MTARRQADQALAVPATPASGRGASRFDPSRRPHLCDECSRRYKTDNALSDHKRDAHGVQKPIQMLGGPRCIECDQIGKLTTGAELYPHRPDLHRKYFWRCDCGAYCGCHGVTTRPLGNPCGYETRRARISAHAHFDPLWRSGGMGRQDAYTWLSQRMGLRLEQTHIGMMTADQARAVVAHCAARRTGDAS